MPYTPVASMEENVLIIFMASSLSTLLRYGEIGSRG